MQLLERIPFGFEEKNYEIRVLYGDNTINIVAFCNNYPANVFRHQIKLSKSVNSEKLLNTDILKEIVDITKNDIIKKRWGKLAAILK